MQRIDPGTSILNGNEKNTTMKDTDLVTEVRKQLRDHLDSQELSINAAARSINQSAATISQFLKGNYSGDNEAVAERILSWLMRERERGQNREILTKTLLTVAVKRILMIARLCHVKNEIGVATGDAGLGKTRGVHLYMRENPDAILLEVIPGLTAKNMMSKLHRDCGYDGRGTIYDMSLDVIDKLKGSNRLILVDEAENLPYKALELLRRIHDLAGIGILLVGMPVLLINLRGKQGEFRQLYSRVGVKTTIPTLHADSNMTDVKLLVHSAIPGSNGLWKQYAKVTNNARTLSKLLKRSLQIAAKNNTDVTPEIVRQAEKLVMI